MTAVYLLVGIVTFIVLLVFGLIIFILIPNYKASVKRYDEISKDLKRVQSKIKNRGN